MILSMTRPPASTRVLLVADSRAAAEVTGAAPIRRYRLARLRFDTPSTDQARYDHLKRVYD